MNACSIAASICMCPSGVVWRLFRTSAGWLFSTAAAVHVAFFARLIERRVALTEFDSVRARCDVPCRTRGLDLCGQATKGTWGMSWHQEAMKGVEDCDKPGEVVKQMLIPGFLNQRALNT